jgi:hypothetical protein
MGAGRELDALVAEKVMGWKEPKKGSLGELFPSQFNRTLRYSTDIADAWRVADKSQLFSKHGFYLWFDGEFWCVGDTNGVNDCSPHTKGATAPLAICLAALKAVGYDIQP